jgi:Uma2 family endonuclease
MNSAAYKRLTVEQYLEIERAADQKSEFYDGEMFAMSGGSRFHSTISVNLGREFSLALKGRPCLTLNSDMRVKAPSGLYTYPDLSALCGEPRFEGKAEDILLNPMVVVEVLSPSTEAYDRGAKFRHYGTIPSLKEYILISQDVPSVERFVLGEDNQWTFTRVEGLEGFLEVSALDIRIPTREIYANVTFAPEDVQALSDQDQRRPR